MNKIYRPHKESGYIAKTDYEQTSDSDGQADWLMFYQPGPKARSDYRVFTKRGGPVTLEAEPLTVNPPALSASQQPDLPLAEPEPSPLEAELIGYGITPEIVGALVRDHDAGKIRSQIEILEWYNASKPGKIDDPAAWLVSAIKSRSGRAAPKGFISRAERERQAEAARQRQQAEAEARRREREEKARQEKEEQAADA